MLKTFESILKMILVIIVIFLIPFILPIIFKILVNMKVFTSIEEFKNIANTLNNMYTIIYIAIGIVMLLWFFHKWEDIKEIIKNMRFSLNFGDKSFSAERVASEELKNINEQKDFINKLSQENRTSDSEITMKEIKEKLGITANQSKTKCKECNKEELKEENVKLRNFAAYNMLNSEARSLLHVIYNEKYIETEKFKSKIIQGYKRRNKKNIKFNKNDINKIAQNKYDTIYDGLKFLNIIEPSEDDKTLKLTQDGKRFVEKYIEKKEVV